MFRLIMVVAVAMLIVGCGHRSEGESEGEQPLDEFIESVVQDTCTQAMAEECWVYESMEECVPEEMQRFRERWPADECEGRIDEEALEACLIRHDTAVCN